MLTVSLLVPVLTERKCSVKSALCIFASAVLAMLLRKTGLYELGTGLIAAALYLQRKSRRRLLCATLSALIICFSVNDALYPALGIRSGSVVEALSIPLQQTVKYCLTYPEEITPEEYEIISEVLDCDNLTVYNRKCSDSVKALYKKDNPVLFDYLKTWFKMFFKHPISYIETFFETSSAVLNPEDPWLDPIIQIVPEQFDSVTDLGISYSQSKAFRKTLDCIREISLYMPIANLFAMAGLYTWGFMLCFTQIIRKKAFPLLFLSVPAAMNVLVCIASPINASIRYELPLIAMLPLLLGLTTVFSVPISAEIKQENRGKDASANE